MTERRVPAVRWRGKERRAPGCPVQARLRSPVPGQAQSFPVPERAQESPAPGLPGRLRQDLPRLFPVPGQAQEPLFRDPVPLSPREQSPQEREWSPPLPLSFLPPQWSPGLPVRLP